MGAFIRNAKCCRKPKKKKTGRKLFTQNYDDIDEETTFESEPKTVKKKTTEEPRLNIEIPRFTHKLFDSKQFGSPSHNKTPKSDLRRGDLKKVLTERKTPFAGKLFYVIFSMLVDSN